MESNSSTVVVPVNCSESDGHEYAAMVLLENEVEALNSLSKSMARPASGVISSSLSNGAVAASLPVQSSLIPPFIESIGFEAEEKFDQSHISLVFPKHELISDGVICHNLKPCHPQCHPQSDMFEVQLSETCQRRFVMFDHSGSKNRIIFHPSMVNELPTLLESPQNTKNFQDPKYDARSRALGPLKETLVSPPFSADYPSFDALLPPGWRSTLLTRRDEDLLLASYSAAAEPCSRGRTSNCLSRENTEDLEALLWSDDEMSSTGHSPSDLTRSNIHSSSTNDRRGYGACFGKKRKAHVEAETDSTATSGNLTSKKIFCSDSELLGRISSGRGSGYDKEGLPSVDLSFAGEVSSSGSTNNHMQMRVQLSTHEPKKARKEKVQTTLRILRSIIPGGESMDTAFVLDEAVQFVKNLQAEVQKLEVNKFA